MATRSTNPPYTATGDVDAFFERIRGINEPPKAVDRTWVESFGFETGHPQSIPSMLKWLRVIGDDGMSTGVWGKLRVPATREATLAELVREAYAPIFESIDLATASNDDIEGAFLQAYSIGDARRHIRCFLTLCRHAGVEVAADASRREAGEREPRIAKPAAKKPRADKQRAPKVKTETPRKKPPSDRQPATATATVSVNVELPGDWDDEKVEARVALVAKALRDNGLA